MILKQFPDQQTFVGLSQSANVIPVCASILADMETPVSILRKFFKKTDPCFLLESVEGGERWARYSFLGLSAHGTVQIFSNHVEIRTGTHIETIAHHGDPLNVMREVTKRFIPTDIPELPRFWSGLTGYFTYEMVSFFENIPISLPEGTPYAQFIIPEQMVIFDNVKQTLTCLKICYLSESDNAEARYAESVSTIEQMIDTLHTPLEYHAPSGSTQADLQPETPAEDYKKGGRDH